MNKFVLSTLRKWNLETDVRTKLQHTYLALAIVGILAAGLVGLVRYEIGQTMVTISFICLGAFVLNAVIWALLNGFVLMPLDYDAKTKLKKTTTLKKK